MASPRNHVGGAPPSSLFSKPSVTSDGPWRSRESFYAFISRHSDPIAAQARARINTWFGEYPTRLRPELRSRINGDEDAFYSVYFELLFHHLLLKQGYTVEVHPDLGLPKRPDFLATSKSGEFSVIVEVTTATAASPDLKRGRKLTRELMDAVRNLEHQHWKMTLQIEGAPRTTIPKKKLIEAIQAHLQELDNQFEVNQAIEDLPTLKWGDDEVELTFYAYRKNPHEGRKLISEPANRSFIPGRPDNLIESKVNGKLPSRYGEISRPYVVAVGLASVNPDHIEVVGMDGKFDLQEIFARTVTFTDGNYVLSDGKECFLGRSRGVFSGGLPPKNQRISALLVARQAYPWNLHSGKLSLYRNPHALYPCAGIISGIASYNLRDDRTFAVQRGQSLLDLLE